jgi:hypothetical protein
MLRFSCTVSGRPAAANAVACRKMVLLQTVRIVAVLQLGSQQKRAVPLAKRYSENAARRWVTRKSDECF